MQSISFNRVFIGCLVACAFRGVLLAEQKESAEPNPKTIRLPEGVLPTIGCWFWHAKDFEGDNDWPFVDMVAAHAGYNLLTTSIRAPEKEVTDDAVHDQIKKAAGYAHARGIGVVMDLDVRLARAAFQKAHPDELQEMLRVREVALSDAGEASITVASETPSDHYTHSATPYIPLAGRLVMAYSYVRGPEGIDPETVRELSDDAYRVAEAGTKQVVATFSCGAQAKGRHVCAMVAFTHFTPDVFAPHLFAFQRGILAKYADTLVCGACKDEWGFPPCFDGNPAKNDHWFSKWFAAAYAEHTGGRDLVRDALLMTFGERGRQSERQAAINHYMELCRQRNAAIECDFYDAVKATFGPKGIVATHPTWWPYPNVNEIKKNGLDWWASRRDLAQVDEVTPFCARTALAKKWGSPIWYNMYYSSKLADYETSVWTHALGGGRINYHPLFPVPSPPGWSHEVLLRGGMTRGDCRVRLLNFIANAPIDCPVAVVFGHACAMNWAGPGYDDVGMDVASRLWESGFYADLIPSSELADGSLKIDSNGQLRYGSQRYAAAVLYHPEFERPETASLFQQAAKGPTALFRVGEWTKDFDGNPVDERCGLPKAMQAAADSASCAANVVEHLRQAGIVPQEPATGKVGWGKQWTAAPPTKGHCRWLDGTHLWVAGEKDVAGDPIRGTFDVNGHEVTFDGIGVIAVRLDDAGGLAALAAGGLKHFRAGSFEIRLEQPIDLALWRDAAGQMHGAMQDWNGPAPAALSAVTSDWMRLAVPTPILVDSKP